MAPKFANFFLLKDRERTSFELSPKSDAKLYVERQGEIGELEKFMGVGSQSGAHRAVAVILGTFGTGKSHLLHFIEDHWAAQWGFRPVYVTLSGFQRRSGFALFHALVMDKLLDQAFPALRLWARGGLQDVESPESKLATQALKSLVPLQDPLIESVPATKAQTTARAWLLGSRTLTPARASSAGYSSLLHETLGPSDLVGIYRWLSKLWGSFVLHTEVKPQRLLLLIDETQAFTEVVDRDAKTTLGHGMRSLFDDENTELGFILGLNLPSSTASQEDHPILRADVRRRILNRMIRLGSFSPQNSEALLTFVTKLWKMLSRKRESLPFGLDPVALQYFVTPDYQRRIKHVLNPLGSSEGDATPSDIIKTLSILGQHAHRLGIRPIEARHLREWFALKDSTHATSRSLP